MCLSPDAAANKSAAAAIAAGGRDGSNESMHYADPTYVSQNAPLIVKQPGTTVHDPTFWQPLNAQRFVDPQWGHVKTFAGSVHVGKPPFGIPSTAAYKDAAIAVLRATSGARASRVDTSPLAWNRIAAAAATGNLAQDLRLYRTLNGALNDAAVSAWAAKRAYQAPRPISMIRYLAFNEQLPIVAGVTKLVGKTVYVRSGGRWISGASWTSPAPTPASPGWVSERQRVRLRSERGADLAHRPVVRGAGAAARHGRPRRRHRDPCGRSSGTHRRRDDRQARARAQVTSRLRRVRSPVAGPGSQLSSG